jgi:hypothetical protein
VHALKTTSGNFASHLVRWSACAVLLAVVFLLASTSADARSATCSSIESQLASLNRSGGSGSASDRSGYGSAIRQQKRQIARTEQRMRSYQCSNSGHPNCRQLNKTLRKMTRNLRSLENRYDRQGSNLDRSSAKRKRLQREFRRLKCGRSEQRVASLERPNFFQRLLGVGNSRRSREDVRKNSGDILDDVFGAPSDAERRRQARLDRREMRRRELDRQLWSSAKPLSGGNKYRTVCVRRCDGYYFPVSHATDESGFAQDSMACNLMCPGTQMELFSHTTATETPEQMISTVDGTLYTSLKTAFSHREKFDAKCACNFKLVKRSYNIDIPDSVRLAELTNSFFNEKKTALPAWRSDQGVAKQEAPALRPTIEESPDARDPRRSDSRRRRIRVIGDAFFPTQ